MGWLGEANRKVARAQPSDRSFHSNHSPPNPSVKQVLVLDPDDINKVSAASGGEQVFMTHLKANVPTIRQLLRIK